MPAGKPTAADLEAEVARLRGRLDANLSAAETALEQAVEQPVVAGSTGQEKANPLFDAAAKADELALRYREQLDGLLEKLSDARARELTTAESSRLS